MSSFELLKKIDLFRDCTNAELLKIEKLTQKVSFNAGSRIFSRGDQGDAMFLIREGEVEVMAPNPEIEVLDEVVTSLGPGELFGEMALVEGEPRSATVRVKKDLKALRITRDYFEDLMNKDHELGFKIYRRLCIILSHRLRETTERLGVATSVIRIASRK